MARDEIKSQKSSKSRFIAGSISGMITAGVLQPLDVLRTQQQGTFHSSKIRAEPQLLNTTRSIIARHGVVGLWRGTTPSLIRVGLGAGTYFMTLSYLMDATKTSHSSALTSTSGCHAFLSGAFARSFAGALLCPLTVVKARMEWDIRSANRYRNVIHALKTIVAKEGVFGLYRGLVATICRDAPFSGFYVMFYTQLKDLAAQRFETEGRNSMVVNFTSGLVSGLAATILTHPIDTIKTRLQLPHESSQRSISILPAVRRLYREEGVRGFFRGYAPRMMKRAVSTAITWTLFEHIAAARESR